MKKLLCILVGLFLASCGSSASDAAGYIGVIAAGGGGGTGRPSYNTGIGFYVVNDQGNYTCSSTHPCKLYDANGTAFRPHGANELHYDNGLLAQQSLYLTGATAARLNVAYSGTNCPTAATCSTTVAQNVAISHSLVPIIASGWGTPTGSPNDSDMYAVVDTWVTNSSLWKPDEKYYILNVANEWGIGDTNDPALGTTSSVGALDTNGTAWASAYKCAIARLRGDATLAATIGGCNSASVASTNPYLGTILIDVGSYGKSYHDIIDQGQTLLNFDPQHNVVFSVHMYDYTACEATCGSYPTIATWMAAVDATGLPYMVGEFGHDGDALNTKATIAQMMGHCETAANCLGSVGWAWDPTDAWAYLPSTTAWDGNSATLTTYGQQIVFDSTYGLCSVTTPCNANSRYPKATIFP